MTKVLKRLNRQQKEHDERVTLLTSLVTKQSASQPEEERSAATQKASPGGKGKK